MKGSFPLDERTIDEQLVEVSPGAYTLGSKRDSIYYVRFVGRSDTDVKAQLKTHIGQYDRFKYGYSSSPEGAFDKECELYHAFHGPEGKLDNKNHPESPDGSEGSCSECSIGPLQDTDRPLRVLSSTLVRRPRNYVIAAILILTLLNLIQFGYLSNLSTYSRGLQATYNDLRTRYDLLNNRYQTVTAEYARAKQEALIPPYTQISAGSIEWAFKDLQGDVIHWKVPIDTYRRYVNMAKPTAKVMLRTTGLPISTPDLRPYLQPTFFQNVISDLTQGRSDRDFVREVDNIKNQIVVYGETLGNAPYKFPVETLTEGKGNCADTTLLMASMLTAGNIVGGYNLKVYVWYVQMLNHAFLSDNQLITTLNHAIVQVVFSDGEDWSIETTSKSFYTYSQGYAGWKQEVTTIGITSQAANEVKPAATPTMDAQYLETKYPGLLASVGALLFSFNVTTLDAPCASFRSNDFMIGYCYVDYYGSSGIKWNYLQGPPSSGLVVLMDYPTATGTWQSIYRTQFYQSATSILPIKMNGAYGHAYIFAAQ